MTTQLRIIPDSCFDAAENMARDLLLLNHYDAPDEIRLRHYRWAKPAYTFGLSQAYDYARAEAANPEAELVRRPTGGGVVDHQNDWTYSLVIPASHRLGQIQPIEIYRAAHESIVRAMRQLGAKVALNRHPPESSTPSVCFQKPELFDIVVEGLPTKVAGAAQKRTRSGFLIQGSIWKPALPDLDWDAFKQAFIDEIARLANAGEISADWPAWDPRLVDESIDQYRSVEWNRRR